MPFKIPTPLSQASAEKRSAEGAASSQPAKKAKLPPLSDLVAMEAAPKRAGAQRLPAVANLNVCIYKVGCSLSLCRVACSVSFRLCLDWQRSYGIVQVTDKASDAWPQFEGSTDTKLWQVQMDHAARPSMLFDLRGSSPPFRRPLFSHCPRASKPLLFIRCISFELKRAPPLLP